VLIRQQNLIRNYEFRSRNYDFSVCNNEFYNSPTRFCETSANLHDCVVYVEHLAARFSFTVDKNELFRHAYIHTYILY